AEDVVDAVGIVRDGKQMAMVGSNNDQPLFCVGFLECLGDGAGKLDSFCQGAVSITSMVGVIDAATLNHEEEPFLVLRENIDSFAGLLGQRRFTASVSRAVRFIF